jgi:PilZ domain-containing protein
LQIRRFLGENSKTAMDIRLNRRLSDRIPFRYKIKYGSWSPVWTGNTINLSEGGIGIKANKILLPESEIVTLLFMDDEMIKLEGIVAWVSLPETLSIIGLSTMGINFLGNTDNVKRIYQQIISDVYQ